MTNKFVESHELVVEINSHRTASGFMLLLMPTFHNISTLYNTQLRDLLGPISSAYFRHYKALMHV
jgi:hypothetical protein